MAILVIHTSNPSTQGNEVRRLQVQSQCVLHDKFQVILGIHIREGG